MKIIISRESFTGVLLFALLLMSSCKPIQNLKQTPVAYKGSVNFERNTPIYEPSKKTVVIIADNKMTEIFDMLAPFYLFNTTGKANVLIIAKEKTPILVKNGLFVLPQLTFHETDSLGLQADVIVIPALSIRDEHQDTILMNWIKTHFTPNTKMLAICDGASTAAATGFYDGKPLTCHASDYEGLKAHFSKPSWVQQVSVTQSGNLFSTAGVSNAVEGSLTIINELFGRETMQKISVAIHYPHKEINTSHQSIAINFNSKLTIARKVILRKNNRIGLLLENGINEFDLASVLDTYGRTFPLSFSTFILNDSTVRTKFGLTLVCPAKADFKRLDELHLLMPDSFSKEEAELFKDIKLVRYDGLQTQYPIDVCLKQIADQYGHKFENVVKQLLDYN